MNKSLLIKVVAGIVGLILLFFGVKWAIRRAYAYAVTKSAAGVHRSIADRIDPPEVDDEPRD